MSENSSTDSDDTLDIVLDIDISKRTSELADENRAKLDEHGVHCIDVMGSVGSGKTTLIVQMLQQLRDRLRAAVIAGDITTRIDAERIQTAGVPVLQIQTGGMCHLDAPLIAQALEKLNLANLDLVIIENVGNLICPAAFPIGAHQHLVILSVTEGPHMVLKHPIMVNQAEVVAINKVDLAEAMDVSVEQLRSDIHQISNQIRIVPTNAREGHGVEALIDALGL